MEINGGISRESGEDEYDWLLLIDKMVCRGKKAMARLD
jgi:hypothetical protein